MASTAPQADEPIIAYDLTQALRSFTSQQHLRDNLLPHLQYITSLQYGDLTDQVLVALNLLYFAQIAERVAILPSLVPPERDMPQAGAKRVGDLFDLDRFRRDTGMVVVEVADLKQASPRRPLDGIGCYSTHFELAGEGNGDPAAFAVHRTEVSYLPMLTSVRKNAGEQISRTPDGFALTFDGLLQWTEDRAGRGAAAEEVIAERPSLVRPEENLLCLDDAYHLRTGRGIRIPFDGEDPVWLSIGRFLHFRPFWHRLADDYLRRVFQLDAPDPIPSYIAAQLDPHGASLTSTRSISDAIDRVRQRMASRTRKGVRVLVIGARDALENVEIDNTWTVFDHVALGTRWRDGVWAAPVLDMVVLSRAIGLVGTARDPASGLGALRVESWNGGPTDDMVA